MGIVRASSLHQGRREALQKENKTAMAAFSILAILTAYAAAGPVPINYDYQHEPQVSTKPFRHTAASVTCRTEYVVLWSTKCEEREEQVCQTLVQNLCRPTTRQECHTKQTEVCKESKRNVCMQKFKTEYQPYTESECTTEYKQDCQYAWKGKGNDKVWAPIEGTCQNVPYDSCKEVGKTQARQVAYQECHNVPVAVVPTFTAPAPVPSSPAFNEQPTFEDSQPLDQQRGVAFEDEDDHASVDDPTTLLQEVNDDKKPSTQLQGGLSTLDEIL